VYLVVMTHDEHLLGDKHELSQICRLFMKNLFISSVLSSYVWLC